MTEILKTIITGEHTCYSGYNHIDGYCPGCEFEKDPNNVATKIKLIIENHTGLSIEEFFKK